MKPVIYGLLLSLLAIGSQAQETPLPLKDELAPSSNADASCPWSGTGATYFCYIDLDTGTKPICADQILNHVNIIETTNGAVVEVDTTGFQQMLVGTVMQNSHEYALHIGNSPSNNGWGGDSGHFSNDSEAHLYNSSLFVYGNDNAGTPLLAQVSNAVPAQNQPVAWAAVCDGIFRWYSYDPVSQTGSSHDVVNSGIFQIDGNEADANPNGNDRNLYIGLERTIGNSSRTGGDLIAAPSGTLNQGIDLQIMLSQ